MQREEAASPTCSSMSKAVSTLEPQTKVQQWLMTNPVVTSGMNPEQSENAPTVGGSRTSSKQMSPSITASSTGKESSYDIINAPSPPPPRDEFQQVKLNHNYLILKKKICISHIFLIRTNEAEVGNEAGRVQKMLCQSFLEKVLQKNEDVLRRVHRKLNSLHTTNRTAHQTDNQFHQQLCYKIANLNRLLLWLAPQNLVCQTLY